MNATLLVIATTLSGIIVFMKNDENTRRAATHAAMTIDTGHLASNVAVDYRCHFLTASVLEGRPVSRDSARGEAQRSQGGWDALRSVQTTPAAVPRGAPRTDPCRSSAQLRQPEDDCA